jgi:hypothetical protein
MHFCFPMAELSSVQVGQCKRIYISPSPGISGGGLGRGLYRRIRGKTPTLTLPRSTGGGDKEALRAL